MTEPLDKAARTWYAARQVVIAFLKDLHPGLSHEDHEHNAAALLARLAYHDPPLIVTFAREES